MGYLAGFTSTGSKRPEALFGDAPSGIPLKMSRSNGCRVWDADGREYLDFVMALGAVALGYGHPAVVEAAVRAIQEGGVGSLAPVLEEQVAETAVRLVPGMEQVRFLKTGAEATAAAVRLARVSTGREHVLGCGYHGWLDWCERGSGKGVPAATRSLYAELPFNEPERSRELIRAVGDRLAAVVFEPVILDPPSAEWLAVLREETTRCGAVLVVDEVKTVCRLAVGGGCERFGISPDLVVVGKAIANGFPLAAVGGRADLMRNVARTWISSTLSTEWVSLAAASSTLQVMAKQNVPSHLARIGGRLLRGLEALARRHESVISEVKGLPEMCFLQYRAEAASAGVARWCAARGLLFKRSAYNFVSLAHDEAAVDRALDLLDQALSSVARTS